MEAAAMKCYILLWLFLLVSHERSVGRRVPLTSESALQLEEAQDEIKTSMKRSEDKEETKQTKRKRTREREKKKTRIVSTHTTAT